MRVGIDIEEIYRFESLPYCDNELFYKNIFTDREIEYCMKHKNPYPHFATRFCAKEAYMKAIDNTKGNLRDIEILTNPNGKPFITKNNICISLSHTKKYATAMIIIL